jgi:hypothetical protein
MGKKLITLCICLLIIPLCGCSIINNVTTNATTAEDFVKKHAKAYNLRDAKAVAAMTLCAEDLEQTTIPENIKQELRGNLRDSLVQQLKRDMKQDDMWSKAWEDTQYVKEQDHGDHITVDVTVGYSHSSIVLVRVGKILKIAPNPSSFQ